MINDAKILSLIEQIGNHYRNNISNRFIRPALRQLPLDDQAWSLIESLAEKPQHYQQYQGFYLDELYRFTLAAAYFVSLAKRELVPTIQHRLSSSGSSEDRVLKDIAVNTFASNLKTFADLVYQLYLRLVEVDKLNMKGRRTVHSSIPELQGVEALLSQARE